MSVLDDFFTAMHKGAALVYHDLLAVEEDIKQWRLDNPTVAALVDTGVKYGTMFLTAHGIPIAGLESAGLAVLATLRDMASEDASVNSKATGEAVMAPDATVPMVELPTAPPTTSSSSSKGAVS